MHSGITFSSILGRIACGFAVLATGWATEAFSVESGGVQPCTVGVGVSNNESVDLKQAVKSTALIKLPDFVAGQDISTVGWNLDLDAGPLAQQPGKLDLLQVGNTHGSKFYVVGDDGTKPSPPPSVLPTSKNCGRGKLQIDCHFQLAIEGAGSDQLEVRRQQLISLAIVHVLTRNSSQPDAISVCTGSHLGNGVVLTAHHCWKNSQTGFSADQATVVFGRADLPFDVSTIWNTGLVAKPVNPDDKSAKNLDFLFLSVTHVPAPYALASLPIANGNAWTECSTGTPLEAFVVWDGHKDQGSPQLHYFEKRYSADSDCKTLAGICPATIGLAIHGCDTSESSSGSPLFLRGGHTIVAVHADGLTDGAKNCAIPTSLIWKALANNSLNKNSIAETGRIQWVPTGQQTHQ